MPLSREEAIWHAWNRGSLRYKLRRYQSALYDAIWAALRDPECAKFCSNIARRFGKTTVQTIIACEVARQIPGAMIRYAAPTAKSLKKITLPIMRQVVADAPAEFAPEWKAGDSVWVFPNGSEIHIAGVNGDRADDLRGTASHLALVDEAGFVDDLKYLIGDVLMPQVLDTGGTLLLSSTPPRTPAHDYVEMAHDCADLGHYIHQDIYATNKTPAEIELLIRECGGTKTSRWKREYLAMFVIDEALAIIPEWGATFDSDLPDAKSPFVCEAPVSDLTRFWHRYVCMDTGVRDLTAVLFGYYDFKRAKIVIEDELIINGPELTTGLLAALMEAKEGGLQGYRDAHGADKVYKRVADNNNLQLIQDLNKEHKQAFIPTSKDELIAMVNELRTWISAGKIEIHPRCVNLLGCLKNGIWKNTQSVGREFGRAGKFGHFDALAALIYLVRNIDQHVNPIPPLYGMDPTRQIIFRNAKPEDPIDAALKRLLLPRRPF